MLPQRPNHPADDGNVLVGVRNALLIEGGVAAMVAFLVALLQWLF